MNNELLKKIGKMLPLLPEEALQEILDEWDPIIRVDRTVRATCLSFVEEVKYPEFELMGPSEFDIRKIERWYHPKQINRYVTVNEIHDELLAKKLLEGCLNILDLMAIKSRGVRFFRKHFLGKNPSAWKSPYRASWGNFNIMYLYERDDEVRAGYHCLDDLINSDYPALRFAN